jgi:hypothetical protein
MVAGISQNMGGALDDLDGRILEETQNVAKKYEATVEKMEKLIGELKAQIEGLTGQVQLEQAVNQELSAKHVAEIGELNAKLGIQAKTIDHLKQTHNQQMAGIRNAINNCPVFDEGYWYAVNNNILTAVQRRYGAKDAWRNNTLNLTNQKI